MSDWNVPYSYPYPMNIIAYQFTEVNEKRSKHILHEDDIYLIETYMVNGRIKIEIFNGEGKYK